MTEMQLGKCLLCLLIPLVTGYPSNPDIQFDEKRDLFMSRGWGAGGMPFSVLYMNPQGLPRVEHNPLPDTAEALVAPKTQQSTVRTMPVRNPVRRHHSIIPQLFVSYGWGPLGRH